LRDTSGNGGGRGSGTFQGDRLGTAREVRGKEIKGSARDAIVGGEAVKKD